MKQKPRTAPFISIIMLIFSCKILINKQIARKNKMKITSAALKDRGLDYCILNILKRRFLCFFCFT